MLVAAGVESTLGVMARADGAARTDISSTAIRFGLGLGGSGGAVVLVSLNSPTLDYLRGRRQDGSGIALALPACRFPADGQATQVAREVCRLLSGLSGLSQAAMRSRLNSGAIDNLFTFVQLAFTAATSGPSTVASQPSFLSVGVPVPGFGGGVEASAYITAGYVQIGSAHGGEPVMTDRRSVNARR
jgi:hypothetical protein